MNSKLIEKRCDGDKRKGYKYRLRSLKRKDGPNSRDVKELIRDVNIAIAVEAIQAIGNLARGLRAHFSGSSRFLFTVLLDKVGKFSASTQNQDPNWTFNQDVLREELARMIIVDGLPFSFVEKEGFKRFLSYAEPRFHMISRTTIGKDCIELYLSERNKLKTLFELSASRVCLTTDLWTSIQNLGYICLTAHFIDRDWKLHKKIINFCVLPTPHRGEAIAQAVDTCLLSWGLEKVCTITVDNASSNDTAAAKLAQKLNKRNGLLLNGELFHVRCFAHILNLIVNDGINEVKKSILRIREFVKYVRSSPSRLQAFKKCVEEERIWSLKSLCLDVPTRWNSTYLMLKSAIDFQKALERLAEQNPSLGLRLVEQDTSLEVSEEPMSEDDWLKIRDLFKFLEYFYNVTKRISGSKYITCNKYFREVFGVQTVLLRWTKSEDLRFREMAIKMNAKFEKYCNIRKLNLILIIAVVLDPCFKMKYVKFCYKKLYSSEEVNEIIGKVKSLMERLFRHYKSLEITSPTGFGAHLAQNLEDVYVSNEKEDGLEEDRDWKIFFERRGK
ncbi:zinc finger BED domain-containing protein RICESLEEPER 2-like [Cornus florida]|uniref:zinc finger BED domain-containing protein RICESLEEPER 2-like n=1 Tax=Cornus florida TaxID=4283 RepID=UPI00289E52CB|nr:zinc finger BED domain-containing protein RICESLEEPER 2-like [Cornus florida]